MSDSFIARLGVQRHGVTADYEVAGSVKQTNSSLKSLNSVTGFDCQRREIGIGHEFAFRTPEERRAEFRRAARVGNGIHTFGCASHCAICSHTRIGALICGG